MVRILALCTIVLCELSFAGEYLVRLRPESMEVRNFAEKVSIQGVFVSRAYELVPGLLRVESQSEAFEYLQSLPEVLYVERNHVRRPAVIQSLSKGTGAAERPPIPAPISRPTEWVKSSKDTSNFGLYQSNTIDVFNKRKFYGSEKIVIAVLDTGVDYTHRDIQANMWRNPGESGGGRETNGIDDDGNGFVDDVVGWDFNHNDGLPYDDYGHGTHVAGIAAAVGGNGYGISGHCARCSVMALKFIGADGSGTDADAIEGLEYAAKMGAHIINSSWGGDVFSQPLFDAFEATSKLGILNSVAAGNSGVELGMGIPPSYPAMYRIPGLTAAAALYEVQNFIPFWSNYGRRFVQFSMAGNMVYSLIPGNKFEAYSGTSMAAPGISGVLGLMLSYRPNLTFAEIEQLIKKSTLPDSGSMAKTINGGRPNTFKIFQMMDKMPE